MRILVIKMLQLFTDERKSFFFNFKFFSKWKVGSSFLFAIFPMMVHVRTSVSIGLNTMYSAAVDCMI